MRILLAEDDPVLTTMLQRIFRKENFVVDFVANGDDAYFLGNRENYDCVVLDLGLPVLDGATVLRNWRAQKRNFPVLILTARDAWSEKAACFKAGADDYLTKPFLPEELIVRIRALVRRSNAATNVLTISCGPLDYDVQTGSFDLDGKLLVLTAFESRLLTALMMRKEVTVERARLFDSIYETDADIPSNSIEVIIGRLRRKIGAEMIKTVRGLGYRLTAEGA